MYCINQNRNGNLHMVYHPYFVESHLTKYAIIQRKLKYEQSEFAFNKQRNACGTRHFLTAILPTELWTHVSYS